MKILFLHGWQSVPGGIKPTYLKEAGHEVINPTLDDDDFDAAIRTAQTEYDRHNPDVIVGSSRGSAVAMNVESGDTPLILLCPAWKRWGTAKTVKPGTTILHSPEDDVVPFADSEELVKNSGLPGSALSAIGCDHRLADAESLEAMLEACWDHRYHAIHESSHAVVALRLGLTPKTLSIGRTSSGTSGGITFFSNAAWNRDPWRFIVIGVAGKMGTRLLGYNNRLVSENLSRLKDDDELGWQSDEMYVEEVVSSEWEDSPISKVKEAESKACQILERKRALLIRLTESLLAKSELSKDDIRALTREKD